jgi:aryl-alcohol dehydrogenase-like predicted oxidoreductase
MLHRAGSMPGSLDRIRRSARPGSGWRIDLFRPGFPRPGLAPRARHGSGTLVLMQTRRLGSTGLKVTPIGLGLAAVGRPGYINLGRDGDLGQERGVDDMRRRAHAVLDAAYAAGIRYFDAARSYGLAESFLASWLTERGIPPGDVTVGSKWGYTYTADWVVGAEINEVKDHSLATLERQLVESRAQLGSWLRLYQIHSATLESGVLRDPAVLGELARLRAAGLSIGLSVSGPRQADAIRAALDARVDGSCPFDTVQATWNVLEPSAGAALAEARSAGLGILVKEALANGRLVVDEEGADPERVRAIATLGRIAGAMGAEDRPGRDAIAIAAALAQPWADVVLSGAVTGAQVGSNVEALRIELGPGDLAQLAELAVPAERYWATRSALAWT